MKVVAPYRPFSWQIAPWRDKAPVLLLAGPAGTGKSWFAAEKVHGYLLKYPNATGLVLRKTRESLGNSFVLFMERSIIGGDQRVRHIKSEHRFEYSNGSILAYGGMKDEDQRQQIRSIGIAGGVDIALMEEAIAFTWEDFFEVGGRLRGHAAPWRQLILCTNPGPPSHWINQNLILGKEASVYQDMRPEDNPYNPSDYIARLKRMTGIMYKRLYLGQWVQAEGLVYANFDEDNLTDEEPDLSLPFELGYDDGYRDPRAILFIQRKGTQVLVFDEIYHTGHVTEQCVREVLEKCAALYKKDLPDDWKTRSLESCAMWCRQNEVQLPELAVGSPEANELQAKFKSADIPTREKPHKVVEGIEKVRSLICDGQGVRTLKVHSRCSNVKREITELYIYPPAKEGSSRDNEKPQDGNDHAADAFRYWGYMRA